MQVTGASIQQLEPDKPRKRCRKWRLWLTVRELDTRPNKRFSGKYMEALDALEVFKAEYEQKAPPAGTVGDYAEKWREWRVKSGEYAPGTLANDLRNIRALARSSLFSMELTKVTPSDCRNALMWVKDNPERVETLSNTSMNKIYQTLNSIMSQAYDDELIASNPMARISAPKPDTREREALSPGELIALLDKLDALPLDGRVMAVYIICLAGLRRGEACALYLSDIHDGLLTVNKAIKERTGRIDAPKTPSGVRTIPIPQRLQDKVLEWLKTRPNAETLCCTKHGKIMRPQYLQRWWAGDSQHRAMGEMLGYPGLTLHDLRHSNLSMVSRHMSVFDLKTYAGWASIEPARVYIHDDMETLKSSIASAWDASSSTESAPPSKTGQTFLPSDLGK